METPRDKLDQYYKDNGFDPDGGEGSSHVKVEALFGLHLYIPNFDARRKVLLYHDLHHLITGYKTDHAGEGEISAWEIASGCRKYWAAFAINTFGVLLGVFAGFKRSVRAFTRGRRTGNLYYSGLSPQEALDVPIEELRKKLKLDQVPMDVKPSAIDVLAFLGFLLFGYVYALLALVFLPLLILYNLYVLLIVRPGKTANTVV